MDTFTEFPLGSDKEELSILVSQNPDLAEPLLALLRRLRGLLLPPASNQE